MSELGFEQVGVDGCELGKLGQAMCMCNVLAVTTVMMGAQCIILCVVWQFLVATSITLASAF